ncbi:hypothetical protein EYF80_046286 [Liparis tanakae]|uniref:Uncharacterized protein n=1 Tax=Liparis tanakae TaxID=230148 RepID=A0A4Z2FT10_9TELE|nr:hypothetical protein EYF80_046286 [Liparis tanakae]
MKFNLRANRSTRTGFRSRKARLMERASETAGELRSRSGSSMMCCAARAEPGGGEEQKKRRTKVGGVCRVFPGCWSGILFDGAEGVPFGLSNSLCARQHLKVVKEVLQLTVPQLTSGAHGLAGPPGRRVFPMLLVFLIPLLVSHLRSASPLFIGPPSLFSSSRSIPLLRAAGGKRIEELAGPRSAKLLLLRGLMGVDCMAADQ